MGLVFNPRTDFSQHGEQKVIFDYFSKVEPLHKLLVDVGAFGRDMSNTYILLKDHGWRGLLIEANSDRAEIVKKEFDGLQVDILNVAVGDKEELLPLYLHSELGHDSLLQDWYPQDLTDTFVITRVLPLHKILSSHEIPCNFDLLSVDTEGYDEKILTTMFVSSPYRPRMIVTECTSYQDPINLFADYGYQLLTKTGNPEYGNFIFVYQE